MKITQHIAFGEGLIGISRGHYEGKPALFLQEWEVPCPNAPLGVGHPGKVKPGCMVLTFAHEGSLRMIQSCLSYLHDRILPELKEEARLKQVLEEIEREESKPAPVQTFDFGGATNLMRQGYVMSRQGFNKPHQIAIQQPDENSANNKEYFYIVTPEGHRVPWTASQCDLLKRDWYIISRPAN